MYKKEIVCHIEDRSDFLAMWKEATHLKPHNTLSCPATDAKGIIQQ